MKRRLLALILLLTTFVSAAQAEIFLSAPPADWAGQDVLTWTIFAVSQGDAMLLQCGGESMLVDGGPKPFREDLRDWLDVRIPRHLKYIVATHNHDDHMDGLYYLFTYGFTADHFMHGYSDVGIRQDKRATKTVDAAKKNGVPVRRIGHGDTFTLGGANIEVLHCTSISGANARSLVLRVDFGDCSFLLCADITGKTQRYFVDTAPEKLDVDVMKMPHHAVTPAVPEFLDAASAGAYIVTDRVKNVHSKSMAQLEARGMPAFFSGNGHVTVVTNGTDIYITQELPQEP